MSKSKQFFFLVLLPLVLSLLLALALALALAFKLYLVVALLLVLPLALPLAPALAPFLAWPGIHLPPSPGGGDAAWRGAEQPGGQAAGGGRTAAG